MGYGETSPKLARIMHERRRAPFANLRGDFVDADLSTVLKVALSKSSLDRARDNPEGLEGSKGDAGAGGEGHVLWSIDGTSDA